MSIPITSEDTENNQNNQMGKNNQWSLQKKPKIPGPDDFTNK